MYPKIIETPPPFYISSAQRPLSRPEEGSETERVKSNVKNGSELRVSSRIADEVKISPELRVRSKSSRRPDDFVNCGWFDYNQ